MTSCGLDVDGRWREKTDRGLDRGFDLVISAAGILHCPKWLEVDGMDSFAGAQWQRAEWRHDVDLTGKRIGVIGTGSTGHQVVLEQINLGNEVTVFQRTPQWVTAVSKIRFPEWLRRRWQRKPELMAVWKAAYRWLVQNVV
ncbi:MAG: hypothetical protein AAGH68_11670 [Pseudomonadota bacterium]